MAESELTVQVVGQEILEVARVKGVDTINEQSRGLRLAKEVLRYALLSGQYRSQLAWSEALLAQAQSSLDSLYQALRDNPGPVETGGHKLVPPSREEMKEDMEALIHHFKLFMLINEFQYIVQVYVLALRGVIQSSIGIFLDGNQSTFLEPNNQIRTLT